MERERRLKGRGSQEQSGSGGGGHVALEAGVGGGVNGCRLRRCQLSAPGGEFCGWISSQSRRRSQQRGSREGDEGLKSPWNRLRQGEVVC